MIESALIRFAGDEARTARFIGCSATLQKETHRYLKWTGGFVAQPRSFDFTRRTVELFSSCHGLVGVIFATQ